MPGTMNASWSWCDLGSYSFLHSEAVSAIVDSSGGWLGVEMDRVSW